MNTFFIFWGGELGPLNRRYAVSEKIFKLRIVNTDNTNEVIKQTHALQIQPLYKYI